MPEETQDPEDDNLEAQTPGSDAEAEEEESPLNQSAIDAMVQNAQDSQADELEDLLDDLEETPEDEQVESTSDTDQLEDLVDSLEEEPGEENVEDLLYQATLQDSEESQAPEDDSAEVTGEEAVTTEDELDELDALAAAFDDADEAVPDETPAEEPVALDTASEAQELDSLLSGLDGGEEEDATVADAEEENEEASEEDLGALLEDLDESPDLEETEEVDDVASLLEGLDDPVEETLEEEEAVEDVDALLEDLDEAAVEDIVEETEEEAVEDVDALLEDLDEAAVEDIAEETLEEEEAVEDVDALLEDLDEAAVEDIAEETDEEAVEDVDALLEDLDEAAVEDIAEETLEEEEAVEDVDALLEDLDEAAAEDIAEETDEEAVEDVDALLEDLDEAAVEDIAEETEEEAVEDVDALLEDLDEAAVEDIAEETDEEAVEDVDALLEDLDEAAGEDIAEETEEEAVEDVDALLEDLDDTAVEDTVEEIEDVDAVADLSENEAEASDEDMGALLEDLDEGTEEAEPVLEDLDEIAEPDAEAELLEAEDEVDTDGLLEDLDAGEAEEDAEALSEESLEAEEETADLGELLEDLDDAPEIEEDVQVDDLTEASDLEAEEDLDVAGLLDDIDASEEEAESIEEEALEADPEVLEDQESIDALVDSADEVEDAGELLEDLDETTDETVEAELESLDEADVEIEDLLIEEDQEEETELSLDEPSEGLAFDDLDDLDLDLDDDSLPDLDLDDDLEAPLEDLEEVEEPASEEVHLEDVSLEAEDDLDSLLGDDLLEDDEELFETDLNVGVEHEVAHMLATGQPAPTEEGQDLFDDFASVQASLEDDSPEGGGTILILDDDGDNVGLFQDALVEGDYEFVEATTSDEALSALQTQDIDLLLVNLDTADNHGVIVVDRMADDDTPPIPVVVTSEQSELIEGALQAGASDHFTRPVGIVDLEYQVPRTVANLIKLKRAQHVLAGVDATDTSEDSPSPASDSLDDLLEDDTDDFLLDDDEDLFGDDDDELSFSSSDLEEDEDDDLGPAARLAGAGSARDRLSPLSDQSKIVREHEWTQTRKSATSNLPIYLGIGLLVLVLAGLSGMVTMYVMELKEQEMVDKQAIQHPQPVPVLKPPKVQQAGYEVSRSRVRQPDDYQRQAESVKSRIRNTVRELGSQDGAWWSPWRVMRQAGGSVDVLVNGRGNDEIMEAFGVGRSAVREGLGSRRSMNYLRGVGYDLAGKDADDLTSRETFELLSAREIKSENQIVDVLSRLTDRLAQDKEEQARNSHKKRKRQGTAHLAPSRPDPADQLSRATTEAADIEQFLSPKKMQRFGFAIRLPRGASSGAG